MQENKEERIMKQIKLEINIEACHYDELTEKDRKLIDAACEATKRSYAPYSHFAVGAAALLENDIVITGTNQKMQPTHLVFVQNVPLCFMPILNIRIKQ